jgi:hypothetical protein
MKRSFKKLPLWSKISIIVLIVLMLTASGSFIYFKYFWKFKFPNTEWNSRDFRDMGEGLRKMFVKDTAEIANQDTVQRQMTEKEPDWDMIGFFERFVAAQKRIGEMANNVGEIATRWERSKTDLSDTLNGNPVDTIIANPVDTLITNPLDTM